MAGIRTSRGYEQRAFRLVAGRDGGGAERRVREFDLSCDYDRWLEWYGFSGVLVSQQSTHRTDSFTGIQQRLPSGASDQRRHRLFDAWPRQITGIMLLFSAEPRTSISTNATTLTSPYWCERTPIRTTHLYVHACTSTKRICSSRYTSLKMAMCLICCTRRCLS